MKRRILLVDDEVAILLTLQAVLEINGFEVETAASAREAKLKIRNNQYHMVITDMRMESESAGNEVVVAARKSPYRPAVAMLTAFPMGAEDEGNDVAELLGSAEEIVNEVAPGVLEEVRAEDARRERSASRWWRRKR